MSKTKELFWTFFKIGAFTFGGGYAMVALLQNEFVEEKKWVTKEEFLDMVAIAESTPGPVAVNSATYIGYKIEEHRRQHPDDRLQDRGYGRCGSVHGGGVSPVLRGHLSDLAVL